MATVFKPLYNLDYIDIFGPQVRIFLGGSIEMGAAENWQDQFIKQFKDRDDLCIFNPRRDDWDASWLQDPAPGTSFHDQVKWESYAQEISDIIIYNFDPNTKSPITLLELGEYGTGQSIHREVIVCCPKQFWRYGNVAMFCKKHGITLVHDKQYLYDTVNNIIDLLKSSDPFED